MKQKLLFLFVAMFALTCNTAWADTEKFDWTSVSSTQSPTSDNVYTQGEITLTFKKASGSNIPAENKEGSIRMYTNTTLTIEATEGNVITQVVFTPTDNSYSATNLTYDGAALTSNTWELSSPVQSATLTATKNARFKTIEVTYQSSSTPTKKSADLAFSETSIYLETGEALTAPTFTKATTASVTFTSDNEDVATVDANGVISLGSAQGKATITATSEENDDYNAGSATCVIDVADYNHYVKATSIESGKAYLICAVLTDGSAFYAYPLSSSKTYGYLSGSTSKSADDVRVKTSYDDTFVFTNDETNGWTIKQNEDGRYLYQAGTYNSFNVAEEPTEGQYWTIATNDDGTLTITNKSVEKYIQYSPSYTSFGSYASAQTNAILPTLYEFKSATGIQGVSVENKKAIENDAVYNLAGQRVSKSYKGVVIKNGKKFIQK